MHWRAFASSFLVANELCIHLTLAFTLPHRSSRQFSTCLPSQKPDWTDLERELKNHIQFSGITEPDDGWDDDTSPLSYVQLGRSGRYDLIEGIKEHGGTHMVYSKLGLNVRPREVPKPPRRVSITKTAPTNGVALGQAKEVRLEAWADLDVAAVAAQARRKAGDNPDEKRLSQLLELQRIRSNQTTQPYDIAHLEEDSAPSIQRGPFLQLRLTVTQKLNFALLCTLLAFAWGRATDDGVSLGFLIPTQIEALRAAATTVVSVSIFTGLSCAMLAAQRGKSVKEVSIFAFRGLMGGLFGLNDARQKLS